MKRPTAYKIALFIVACIAALAALCYFFPKEGVHVGSLELRFPTLSEVLGTPTEARLDSLGGLDGLDTLDTLEVPDTIPEPEPIPAPQPKPQPRPQPKPRVVQALDTVPTPAVEELVLPQLLYLPQALAKADSQAVRVVYYGDSQVEGDRMTMMVRRALQKRFGGGGVGLLPLHQTVASRTVVQSLYLDGVLQSASGGPKRYLAYGPKSARRDTNIYGPMAQVTVLDERLATWQATAPKKKMSDSYFNRVRVVADDSIEVSIDGARRIGRGFYAMPDSSTTVTVTLQGPGDIYGLALETDKGVTVDNIPMRGCAGTIFSSIDPTALRRYYRDTHTALIILQYGGNVVPYTQSIKQVTSYVSRVRQQILFLRRLAPEADIVFVGPSDMVDKEDGETRTHPAVAQIDARLQQMCAQEGVLYFSLFKAMGGAGAMKRWHMNGWAGSDLIHFTRQGADKAGNLLADWLIEQIETAQ